MVRGRNGLTENMALVVHKKGKDPMIMVASLLNISAMYFSPTQHSIPSFMSICYDPV